MRKIKAVSLFFPNTEDCTQIHYEVGKNNVTKIEPRMYSPAEFCNITYYEIYVGDILIAEMHHFSLIEYMD